MHQMRNMLKVALIFTSPYRQGFPPRGMLYIASYVKQKTDDIDFVCYDYLPSNEQEWNQFDVIGFSTMTAHYIFCDHFARQIRKNYKGYIVLGGIHFSLVKKLPDWADFGMIGEGEQTSLELYQLLSADKNPKPEKLKEICGLVFRDNENIIYNQPRKLIENLDEIPFADLDSIDIESYLKPNNTFGTKVGRGLSMMTSRGCAFNCDFCTATAMWHYPRFHSAEYVVDEIQHLITKYQVEMIYITDDNFCTNKKRLKKIAELIEERNIRIEIGASGRIEYYDDEICDYYRRIGIKALSFGFETGSQRMLMQIKQGQKLSVEESIKMANRIASDGIEVQGLFMLNMPGETLDDLEKTLEMVKQINMSKIGITIATPFYGTKWWDVALEQGIVPEKPEDSFWKTYDMQDWQEGRPLFKTEIPLERLKQVYDQLMDLKKQLFYFDWKNRNS